MGKVVFFVIIFTLIACGSYQMNYGKPRDVECYVTDKNVKVSSTSGNAPRSYSYYLIYTSDETFTITDQMWIGKFNSSDLYGKIETGKWYGFKVRGMRIPILSHYPNIEKIYPQ